MSIGGSIFLIALGAVLAYAVNAEVQGVDIQAVGVILMIAGVIGLAISLIWSMRRRRTDVIYHRDGTTYTERGGPVGPADPVL